jgi:hypothetical protein
MYPLRSLHYGLPMELLPTTLDNCPPAMWRDLRATT